MSISTSPLDLRVCALAVYHRCPDGYAKAYARAYLEMLARGGHHPEDLRTQILYIRANLPSWRGDEAKKVRKTLDKYLRETKPGSSPTTTKLF